jgi:hypothetical protein
MGRKPALHVPSGHTRSYIPPQRTGASVVDVDEDVVEVVVVDASGSANVEVVAVDEVDVVVVVVVDDGGGVGGVLSR